MKKSNLLFLLGLVICLASWSCDDDDDPKIENEEEVITTLNYTLTSASGSATLSFVDLDGAGAMDPVITSGTLAANTTYQGTIELLNQSVSPEEDITEEVAEEDLEHQMFFSSNIAGLSVAYNDTDSEGNPLGLATTLTTGDAGAGTLTITLRHEPNKSAEGVSDGNIANASGETDIEVTFDLVVQ